MPEPFLLFQSNQIDASGKLNGLQDQMRLIDRSTLVELRGIRYNMSTSKALSDVCILIELISLQKLFCIFNFCTQSLLVKLITIYVPLLSYRSVSSFRYV